MYPAIEITLHLDRICAGQRQRPPALEAAFRAFHVRHQPAPPIEHPGKGAGPGVAIAGTADESRRCQNLRRGHYELCSCRQIRPCWSEVVPHTS
jgi:hypothetical protein